MGKTAQLLPYLLSSAAINGMVGGLVGLAGRFGWRAETTSVTNPSGLAAALHQPTSPLHPFARNRIPQEPPITAPAVQSPTPNGKRSGSPARHRAKIHDGQAEKASRLSITLVCHGTNAEQPETSCVGVLWKKLFPPSKPPAGWAVPVVWSTN